MLSFCRLFIIFLLHKTTFSNKVYGANVLLSGTNHSCYRPCTADEPPMHCEFNFTIQRFTTMNMDCGNCPYVREDCAKTGCIPGGGLVRTAIVVNQLLPGPQIMVCENDLVFVNVKNELTTSTVTIHWHGIHQRDSLFMDGVPWITQIPILPYSTFTYKFRAEPSGTHIWHGHSGFQESEGLYGIINVRRKEPPHIESLYDFDLPEHNVVIWHWYNQPAGDYLLEVLQRNASLMGYGFTINGKASFKKYPLKENPNDFATTPKEVFHVKKGYRYRFRAAYNAAIYCPVQFSIDGHKLLMIAGDSSPYEPIEVDSFMLGAGNRFDFVLNASKPSDCYWLRIRALGDCDESKTSVHEEALVCYDNVTTDDRKNHSYAEANRPGKLLNPSQIATYNYGPYTELIHVVQLNNTENKVDYSGTPDETIYVQIHTRVYDNPFPGPWPQFDNTSFVFPGRRFLESKLNTEAFCTNSTENRDCVGDLCSCTYFRKIKAGSLVEMVLVDISYNREQDHPVHMHGYQFYVVALGLNGTLEEIKHKNENNLIPKKLTSAPALDSLSVPNRGYAIIRFIANNTGFWMFHCHVTNHMELGMAMVLQVGEREEILSQCKTWPEQCKEWNNSATFLNLNHLIMILLLLVDVYINIR